MNATSHLLDAAVRLAAARPTDDGWSAPEWLTALGAVVAVLLGSSAVAAAFGAVRADAAARRNEYTAAARTLTAWAEYPYRVRRRTSDSPETLAALAACAHDLQEQLADREAWCATEHPLLGQVYGHLRSQLAGNINSAIETGWKSPPITSAVQMVLKNSFPVGARATEMRACLNACVRERFGAETGRPGGWLVGSTTTSPPTASDPCPEHHRVLSPRDHPAGLTWCHPVYLLVMIQSALVMPGS